MTQQKQQPPDMVRNVVGLLQDADDLFCAVTLGFHAVNLLG
jgi:hypothetical protein